MSASGADNRRSQVCPWHQGLFSVRCTRLRGQQPGCSAPGRVRGGWSAQTYVRGLFLPAGVVGGHIPAAVEGKFHAEIQRANSTTFHAARAGRRRGRRGRVRGDCLMRMTATGTLRFGWPGWTTWIGWPRASGSSPARPCASGLSVTNGTCA